MSAPPRRNRLAAPEMSDCSTVKSLCKPLCTGGLETIQSNFLEDGNCQIRRGYQIRSGRYETGTGRSELGTCTFSAGHDLGCGVGEGVGRGRGRAYLLPAIRQPVLRAAHVDARRVYRDGVSVEQVQLEGRTSGADAKGGGDGAGAAAVVQHPRLRSWFHGGCHGGCHGNS